MSRRNYFAAILFLAGISALQAGCGGEDISQPPLLDTTPPGAVTDLAVGESGPTWITLTFTAPADEEDEVVSYDLRYLKESSFPVARFEEGIPVPLGSPDPPGTGEEVRIESLFSSTGYTFRLRAADGSGNWSDPSNETGAVTQPGRPPDPGLSYVPGCLGSLPVENTLGGNLPPDAIPALLDPPFLNAAEVTYVEPANRVFGVEIEGEFFAFPRDIMNFHEVVTFSAGNVRTSATWCPLTFSFLEWRQNWLDPSSKRRSSFGVSGSLLDNNLVLYDRESLSISGLATTWSQLQGLGLSGPQEGQCLTLGRNAVDTTWDLWRRLHPDTKVVTNQNGRTGVRPEDYNTNPYESYWRGVGGPPETITFPDSRLDAQTVVLGVHGRSGSAAVLLSQPLATISVGGTAVVLFQDLPTETVFAFENRVEGSASSWQQTTPDPDTGLPRFQDQGTGTIWSLDGVAVSGPLAGTRLPQIPAFHVYWFAWATFFRDGPILAL